MSAENFKSIYNIPFYLEQKQLITVCGHPSKEIFVPLPILVVVDSFIIYGKLYDRLIMCHTYSSGDEECQGIPANAIGETEVYQQRYNNV